MFRSNFECDGGDENHAKKVMCQDPKYVVQGAMVLLPLLFAQPCPQKLSVKKYRNLFAFF